MRQHLSRLVEQVARAADRRRGVGALGEEHIARLDAAVDVLRADYPAAVESPASAVEEIAAVFDLDDVETRLLVVAAAADLDVNIATAFGLLDWSTHPGHPSMGLALELCGIPTLSSHRPGYLGATGTLRHAGLVRLDGSGPQLGRTLSCPDVVVERMLGATAPSALLATMSGVAVPREMPQTDSLVRALKLGVRLCWVHAPFGAAGTALAAGAFARVGIEAYVIDLRRRRPDAEGWTEVLPRLLLEAGLHRKGVILSSADALTPPDEPALLELLDTARVPVLAVSPRAWNPQWSAQIPFLVAAPRLSLAERTEVWTDVLERAGVTESPPDAGRTAEATELVTSPSWPQLLAMRLTPEEILGTTRAARLHSEVHNRPLDVETLRATARHLSAAPVGDRVRGTAATFEDLILPDEVEQPLRRIASWARHRDGVLSRGAVNGPAKGDGITALFTGSPGTGKTLAAHVIADTVGLELYPVDLSTIVNKYVGETEKNLERVFHEAESMNVVLFFDEADSLFGSRSSVTDARDRYANLEVSFLLQRMEQFDGIVILATNLRGNLDAAFSRRLHFIVHFSDPDAATRRRLWEHHLRYVGDLSSTDPVDLDALAAGLDITGGDIRNIVLGAAFDAAEEQAPVGMSHLRRSATQEFAKLGRRLPESLQ